LGAGRAMNSSPAASSAGCTSPIKRIFVLNEIIDKTQWTERGSIIVKFRIMKSILIKLLLAFLFFSNTIDAQENSIKTQFAKGFEVGFKEGYCYNKYKGNCLTPLTPLSPLPSLNESSQSYQDGFNRGFQTGLDLRRLEGGLGTNYQTIPNYRFNDYVETLPINAYATVGLYLEAKLKGRIRWIQQRLDGIVDLNYSLLYNLDNDAYNRIINSLSNARNNLKGVSGDFADDRIFQQTLRIFNFAGLESEIYSAYRNALANSGNQVSENDFLDLLSIAYDSLNANPMFSLKLAKEAEGMYVESVNYYSLNDIKSKAYESLENYELALNYNEIFISTKNLPRRVLQYSIYRKAVLLASLNKFADALSELNNPILNDINDTMLLDILHYKAEIYLRLDDFQNSLINANRFLASNVLNTTQKETEIRVRQLKAASLRELGKYQEALAVINLAIKENNSTSKPSLYATKGKIIYFMKDYKNALNEFIKTTLLDDKDAESFYYLALCYKKLNQKLKACDNLQKAIKLGSNDALEEYPNICK